MGKGNANSLYEEATAHHESAAQDQAPWWEAQPQAYV